MYQGLQCILSALFDTKKNVNKTFIFIAFYAKNDVAMQYQKKRSVVENTRHFLSV